MVSIQYSPTGERVAAVSGVVSGVVSGLFRYHFALFFASRACVYVVSIRYGLTGAGVVAC